MDLSTYILSDTPLQINRMHMCTWDIKGCKAFVEFGFDFSVEASQKNEICLIVASSFISEADTTEDLYEQIVSKENLAFIFNDQYKGKKEVNHGPHSVGCDISFTIQKEMRFLPISKIETHNGYSKLIIKNWSTATSNYIRFCIDTNYDVLATIQHDITRTLHIYDIRINSLRNLPKFIESFLDNGMELCRKISKCYMLHAVPSEYIICHHEEGFKSLRIVEHEKFYAYLSKKRELKADENTIAFNKLQAQDGEYSFCTEFEHERVGTQQLLVAIGCNLLCSIFFAIGSILHPTQSGAPWYNNMPVLYWIAIVIIIGLIIYLVVCARKKK